MSGAVAGDDAAPPSADPGRPGSRRAAAAIAAAALALYLATGQNLLHGFDVFVYLQQVGAGDLEYWLHALYLPTAWAWSKVLGGVGVEPYEALRAMSAVAAAMGVFASHRAATALGWSAERAALTAIGCATLPAVVHAATVVEIDAITFGAFATAWVPFARLLRGDRFVAAAAVGLVTGIASGFHAAGHLGAAALCGLQVTWGWPRRRLRSTLPRAAVLAAAHLATSALIHRLTGVAGQVTMATNTLGLELPLDIVPTVLTHEVLLPYAPFVVLALTAWLRPGWRGAAAGLTVCLCVYVVVTSSVMAWCRPEGRFSTQGGCERGSFFLALAPALVVLAIAALPRRLAWAAVVVSAVSGLWQQRAGDWPADPPGYASGWAKATAGRPHQLIVADAREWAWIARRHPELQCTLIGSLLLQAERAQHRGVAAVSADQFVVWFGAESNSQRAVGRELLVSERALAALRGSPDANLARAAERLPELYTMERLAADGFAAWSLRVR